MKTSYRGRFSDCFRTPRGVQSRALLRLAFCATKNGTFDIPRLWRTQRSSPFANDAEHPKHISMIQGFGYRFQSGLLLNPIIR